MLFDGRPGVEREGGRETECGRDGREVAIDARGRGFNEELLKKVLILDDEEELDIDEKEGELDLMAALGVGVGRGHVCEIVDDRPLTMGCLGSSCR